MTINKDEDFPAVVYELIGRIALASTNLEAIVASLANFEWEGKESPGNESLEVTRKIVDALRETLRELSLESGLPGLLLWKKYVAEVEQAINTRNRIVHSYKIYCEGKLKLFNARSKSDFEPTVEYLQEVLESIQKLEIDGWFRIVGLNKNIESILNCKPGAGCVENQ